VIQKVIVLLSRVPRETVRRRNKPVVPVGCTGRSRDARVWGPSRCLQVAQGTVSLLGANVRWKLSTGSSDQPGSSPLPLGAGTYCGSRFDPRFV
jgi:hypothetical protein